MGKNPPTIKRNYLVLFFSKGTNEIIESFSYTTESERDEAYEDMKAEPSCDVIKAFRDNKGQLIF